MKCLTPEMAWHNRDPVLSVDVQCQSTNNEPFYRLASGGADSHVLIWHIFSDNSKGSQLKIEFASDLARHQKAVNVVRFSPSAELLASGDDESIIFIWRKQDEEEPADFDKTFSDAENIEIERWISIKTLRLHLDDVYDICWSPDSSQLMSGSVDNTAIIWNIQTGKSIAMLREHKGFVQGVSWDPKNKYIATLSSDRTCRVYSVATKNIICQCSKAVIPGLDSGHIEETTNTVAKKLFHDDTLKTYSRKLTFTPDGKLLIAPTGIIEPSQDNNSQKPINATFVFLRDAFNEPVMYFPSGDQYTVAVRCCPILFELKNSSSKRIFNLPYRIVIAVASKCSVLLYDTEHAAPFAYVTDIHYTRLTDLSWSSDGCILVISSTDGFCTFVVFNKGELGIPYQTSEGQTDAEIIEAEHSDL